MASYTKANNLTALNTSGSWTVAGSPSSTADTGTFSTTYAQTGTVALGGSVTWGGLIVTTGTNTVTINNGAAANWIIGTGGITYAFNMSTAARNLTINPSLAVVIATNSEWNINTGRTMTVTAVIGETGGVRSLTKSGAGTLYLTGKNLYSNGTFVNAGVLQLGNGQGASGGVIRGALTLNNSGSEANLIDADSFGADNGAAATSMTTLTANSGTVVRLSTGYTSFLGGTYTLNGASVIGTASTVLLTFHDFNSAGTRLILASTGTSSITKGVGSGAINLFQDVSQFNVLSGTLTVDMVMQPDINGREPNAAVSKTGAGTLVLTGASTYIGGFTLSAGTVNLGVAQVGSTSGPLGASGTITLGGGTLQYSAANQTDYSSRFSTAASQAYYVDTNGQNVTWASNLTSSGGTLTKSGTGTLTLSGTNTYNSNTTLSAGGLALNNASALGSGVLSISASTTLDALSALTIQNAITINGAFTFTGSNTLTQATGAVTLATSPATITVSASTLTLGGVVSGAFDLAKAGAGSLVLTGVNTYSGSTTISAGQLTLGGAGQLGSGTYSQLISNSGTFAISTSATQTLSGLIFGATGVITKSGTGTLTLSNNSNSYGGGTTLSAGTLNIGADGALGTGTFMISGGTVDVTAARSITNALSIGGSFTFAGSNTLTQGTGGITLTTSPTITVSTSTLTLGGVVSGAFGLTKAGVGTLTLTSASNSYSDATTISAGTLEISGGGRLGSGTYAGNLSVDAVFAYNSTAAQTLSGSVSGAGTITKAQNSNLIFTGSNSFSGLISIASGTGAVVMNSTGSEDGIPSVEVNSGQFVIGSPFAGGTCTIGSLSGTGGNINPNFGATTGTRALSINQTVNGVYAGIVQVGTSSRTIAIVKTGSASLSLSGTNTYTGGTTVSQGTLKAGNTAALGTGAASVASGATLQALASISGRLNIGGNLTNSGGTLRIGGS